MKFKSVFLLTIIAAVFGSSVARASSITVGGFDPSRGGSGSLTGNTSLENLISGEFPGSSFSSASTLTASYLSTVNALIISVGFGGGDVAISPLSASEQSALLGFVKGGGTALLFTDNSDFSASAPAVNASFLAPFGLSAAGTLGGLQSSTIVNSANPVVSGIAGTASGFDTNFPGWYSSLGAAQELATLSANGEPDLAYLAPGALGPGSGAVVIFADGNNLGGEPAGGFGIVPNLVNDDTLILNSLGLAAPSAVVVTPEPSSLILFLSAIALLSPRFLGRRQHG